MKINQLFPFVCAAFTLLAFVNPVLAQNAGADEDRIQTKNSLYIEFWGNALLYSINYDRVLTDHFSARAGIGYYSLSGDEGDQVSLAAIPVTAHYLMGRGNSRLEVGGGVVVLTGKIDAASINTSNATVIGTGVFAYRFQKPNGGVFFKVGFTPIIHRGSFLPWFGLSIGYTI